MQETALHVAAHASANPAPVAGRILGSVLQQKLDKLTDEDPDLCCPVSLVVFVYPVIASDGFIYERASLKQLLANRQPSPMTRETLKRDYRPAQLKFAEAVAFRKQRSQELLEFATEAISEHGPLALAALDRAWDYVAVIDKAEVQTLVAEAEALYGQLGRLAPTFQSQRESHAKPVQKMRSVTVRRREAPAIGGAFCCASRDSGKTEIPCRSLGRSAREAPARQVSIFRRMLQQVFTQEL